MLCLRLWLRDHGKLLFWRDTVRCHVASALIGIPPPARTRSGRVHEAEEGLVYRSQLCRYRAQKRALRCCLDRINRPSPACFCQCAAEVSAGQGIDRPAPILSLDQAAARSHTSGSAGHPGLNTIHRIFTFQEPWIRRALAARGDSSIIYY